MTPWLDDGDVRVYVGDVRAVLAELPDESVDCCITSPPYWGLRAYLADDHDDKHHELGLEPTPDQYVQNMVAVFREVRRVLAPHGTCWLNLGDSYVSTAPGTRDKPDTGTSDALRTSDRFLDLAEERGNRTRPKTPAGLKPKDLVGIPWRVAFALQQPYYAGTIKDERDRIWLAAVIEAEGCMFIHKRKVGQSNGQGYVRKNATYGAGLEVSSTDRVIVERCMRITGIGSICEQSPEQNQRRKQTIYRWNVRSNECRGIIRELYPHFYAKQHEARLLLACPSSGPDAEKAHESLKAIHQGGTPTIDFAPPASMFEEGWYLRSDVIWAKKNCMPESVTDRPTKSHEQVFLLSKRASYFFDQEAVRETSTADAHMLRYHTAGAYADKHGEQVPGSGPHRGIRNRAPESLNGGRNVRSVWEIATQPFAEAHFATFPEELVRRCLLAGCPAEVCRVCGKPRERIVAVAERVQAHWAPGTQVKAKAAKGAHGSTSVIETGEHNVYKTTGWSDCGHHAYRPGVVLDPFLGSGTTALVARHHGRHAVGVELNQAYAEIAARRLQQLSLGVVA